MNRGKGFDPVNCGCARHFYCCVCASCDICECEGEDACGGCGAWAKVRGWRTLAIASDRRVSQDEAIWEDELANGRAWEDGKDEANDDELPPAIHPTRLAGRTHVGEYALSIGYGGDVPDEPPDYDKMPMIYSAYLPRINGIDPDTGLAIESDDNAMAMSDFMEPFNK